MEDYNNEIFLGNSNEASLHDIWNGPLYDQFRKNHFELNPCIKCTKECDMPKIGESFPPHGASTTKKVSPLTKDVIAVKS